MGQTVRVAVKFRTWQSTGRARIKAWCAPPVTFSKCTSPLRLKAWYPNHHYHPGACEKCRTLGPKLLSQNLQLNKTPPDNFCAYVLLCASVVPSVKWGLKWVHVYVVVLRTQFAALIIYSLLLLLKQLTQGKTDSWAIPSPPPFSTPEVGGPCEDQEPEAHRNAVICPRSK